MKNLKHIKRFNESEGQLPGLRIRGPKNLNSELSKETSLSISDISDSKKYVYKYNHNGYDLYYHTKLKDYQLNYMELYPDSHHSFVSDINDARIFTGKQIKSLELNKYADGTKKPIFELNMRIATKWGGGGYIILHTKPVIIEV